MADSVRVNLTTFQALLTPAGQEILQAAAALNPGEKDFLAHFQFLSRKYPVELARAALEIAILRREAAAKFPFAEKMYFTRPALEQASAYEISIYRARRYSGLLRLADLGCSIGSDTLALAALAPTLALDLDPLRLAMAQANLAGQGLAGKAQFVQADLTHPLPLAASVRPGLFFDPSRRAEERRIFSVRRYLPPLEIIEDWLPRFPALGVKLSPGVDLAELAAYSAEIEFISLDGALKEAVLWFGPLRSAARRATLLSGRPVSAPCSDPVSLAADSAADLRCQIGPPADYLYEPDPAILRAGLVRVLAEQLGAAQLDPEIAYLTAKTFTPTPFARTWAIEDWFPFQLKRLRAYLRQRGIGKLTVKKRGSPLEPEALIRLLKLQGEEARLLVLTHCNGAPVVLVCLPNPIVH